MSIGEPPSRAAAAIANAVEDAGRADQIAIRLKGFT
jgi:hypothetical protein